MMRCINRPPMCLHGHAAPATIEAMKQADPGLDLSTKLTRKREFFDEMNRVVPNTLLSESDQSNRYWDCRNFPHHLKRTQP